MMKRVFHKIASITMAFVVLFSTLSFTVNMHYCGETLVDTSFFHDAETCGMEIQKPSTSSECSIAKKDCCSDKQLVVEGQDKLKLSFDTLALDHQVFVASFVYTYINLFEGLEKKAISYRDYVPPLVVKNIYKLDESFLI